MKWGRSLNTYRPPRAREVVKVHLVKAHGEGWRSFCGFADFKAEELPEARTLELSACTCGSCRRVYTLRTAKGAPADG